MAVTWLTQLLKKAAAVVSDVTSMLRAAIRSESPTSLASVPAFLSDLQRSQTLQKMNVSSAPTPGEEEDGGYGSRACCSF